MMRLLTHEFFHQSPVLIFPLIALGLFMLAFVAIAVRTFLRHSSDYDTMAKMPLVDPDSEGGSHE